MGELMKSMEELTAEVVDKMRGAGVKIFQIELVHNELLYIPMGYMVLEKASASHALVYGVRKSLFTSTEQSKDAYTLFRAACAAENRNTARMDAILANMA
jgi:hypothetical protein